MPSSDYASGGNPTEPAEPSDAPRDEVFGFLPEDEAIIRELVASVRLLLTRRDLTPHMLRVVAGVLLALERLPRTTAGVEAEIGLSRRFGADVSYQSLYLGRTAVRLDGGEGAGETVFEVGIGGVRDGGRALEVAEWLARFRSRAAAQTSTADFEWLGDDAVIDWDAEASDQELWKRLERAA